MRRRIPNLILGALLISSAVAGALSASVSGSASLPLYLRAVGTHAIGPAWRFQEPGHYMKITTLQRHVPTVPPTTCGNRLSGVTGLFERTQLAVSPQHNGVIFVVELKFSSGRAISVVNQFVSAAAAACSSADRNLNSKTCHVSSSCVRSRLSSAPTLNLPDEIAALRESSFDSMSHAHFADVYFFGFAHHVVAIETVVIHPSASTPLLVGRVLDLLTNPRS